MSYEMTKVAASTAATTTTIRQKGGQSLPPSSSSSFYNSRRLKLCPSAEIEHCETSKTIVKYIEAKTKGREFFTLLSCTTQTFLQLFKVHCWMELHSCTHSKEWFCNGWHPVYRWHIYNENVISFSI
jgi:hypothetical protein